MTGGRVPPLKNDSLSPGRVRSVSMLDRAFGLFILSYAGSREEADQDPNHCFERRLKREEFVIFCIAAQAAEMLFGPDIWK
ncbi:MAG: hypothetical protein ACLQIB_10110 [Isosphaeraceae bacterium]